ncbi:MAG: hypothetical protein KDA81_04010 [Planctomycetaceae bacterium]|nr:hypothetical protein [Planctomycetaceae bacterium]
MKIARSVGASLMLGFFLVGCGGGGEDITTISPEDQKMLDASHAQAAEATKGAAEASKGIRPGGHK